MALYKPSDFMADMQTNDIIKLNPQQSEELCKLVLEIPITQNMSWNDFNTALRKNLEEYLKKIKSKYEFPKLSSDLGTIKTPDIIKVKSYKGIIDYLDEIKGNKIEENLKNFFLSSLSADEEHNHFAQMFYKSNKMQPTQKKDFLCLYSELLLTHEITRPMLDWIISTYSKVCKGGINKNIGNPLSNGEEGFYKNLKERIQFLRLAFSITVISPDDEEKTAKKQYRKVLMAVLGNEDFNPKSFVEMCYYYVIINMRSIEELESLLRDTAANIILKLFGDTIKNINKNEVKNHLKTVTSATIENFLNFNKNSLSLCTEVIQHFDAEISKVEVKKIVEAKLNRLAVNYFNSEVSHRKTITYEYFHETVELKVTMLKKQFSEWMIGERRFYETYFNIESRTRYIKYGDAIETITASDIEQYAEEIVYEDSLKVLDIKGFKYLGNTHWKKKIFDLQSTEERINEVEKMLNDFSDAVKRYNGDKEIVAGVRVYLEIDRQSLATAIVEKINSLYSKNKKITRKDYLFTKFKAYVDSGISATNKIFSYEEAAVDFETELSDIDYEAETELADADYESEMRKMRWEGFNPLRYHDAMLYMCLNCDYPVDNCDNPMEMFKKINATPGYGYYEN